MVAPALSEHTTLSQRTYNSRAIFQQQSIWSAAITSLGGQTLKLAGMIIRIVTWALLERVKHEVLIF